MEKRYQVIGLSTITKGPGLLGEGSPLRSGGNRKYRGSNGNYISAAALLTQGGGINNAM